MSSLLIKGGRVLDPSSGLDKEADVLIDDGTIREVRPHIRRRSGMEQVTAQGCFVLPGLIDMHTHLREPGEESKETIRTGTEAAAAGGFTTIVAMANTQPVNDSAIVTQFLRAKIKQDALVHVLLVGAVTQGLKGERLANIGEMQQYGIVAVSDDGKCITRSPVMRKALEYAKTFGLPLISHAEDPELGEQLGINEGLVATELGLVGTPNAAEETMVARDCALAQLTRARLHIAHVSTAEALESIRRVKEGGGMVTCEVTPHHLALTDEALLGFRTEAKVNPPLRTELDRRALWQALRQGVIDVIATDHAPHSSIEKETSLQSAASGIVGLETAVSVVWTEAERLKFPPLELFAKLTCNPAKILGLEKKGRLEPGADADVTVFDPTKSWAVNPETFRSKGRNTPFAGTELRGRVVMTIVDGEIVYEGE